MSDRPKFKNASEITAYLEELYKDADMMEDDQRILRYERQGIDHSERFTDTEFKEKHQIAVQKKADSAEWRENHKAGSRKRSDTAEWRESMKVAGKKRSDSLEWRESMQKRSDSTEWRENKRIANQKNANSVEWREKQKDGTQKANNKPISCDGVIYPSRKEAAFAIAPVNRLTESSKKSWLTNQMKKYPERYFYIADEAK